MTGQLGFTFDVPVRPASLPPARACPGLDPGGEPEGGRSDQAGVRHDPLPASPLQGEGSGVDTPPATTKPAQKMPEIMPAAGPGNEDGIAECAIGHSRNMLVPWFLIASWSYYWGDHALISDGLFDRICRDLEAEFDGLEHKHKHLVDRAWLAAGTCGLARDAYPASVRGAAAHLAAQHGVRIPRE